MLFLLFPQQWTARAKITRALRDQSDQAVTAEDTFAFGSGTKPYTAPCLKMLATHGYWAPPKPMVWN